MPPGQSKALEVTMGLKHAAKTPKTQGIGLWLAALLIGGPVQAGDFPWESSASRRLTEIPTPTGSDRIPVRQGSFGAWLRTLPLKAPGAPVHYYNGDLKPRDVHIAVIDIDVGHRDLQQCADAVMRLRAEYLWARGCGDQIAFNFTSGDRSPWLEWAGGRRPVVQGNSVRWRQNAEPDDSYRQFRRYLDSIFTYAGSHSLTQELETVANPAQAEPGDVFIQGGFPGHAVLVVDVAESAGDRWLLLAQSYMPAQEIHLLKRPGSPTPWYPAQSTGSVKTPEWTFDATDLRRFPSVPCSSD